MGTIQPAAYVVGLALLWSGFVGFLSFPAQPEEAGTEQSLEVRYAQAQLRLAEVNLKRVERMNQRVPRSVPGDMVAEYREDVEVAKLRLENLASGKGENDFQVWLRRAEEAAQSAEARLRSGMAVNQRAPGTLDALELERLRLRAELARLRLARGQALADQPRETQVQWQLDYLSDEVQRLNQEVLRGPGTTRPNPFWWY
jgi:DNA repair exonuclease SbcCD ATPase subunit